MSSSGHRAGRAAVLFDDSDLVERVLHALLQDPEIGPNVTAHRTREARAACFADPPGWLHPRLWQALQATGIARLYDHQARALEAARRGENLVIATGTASGKSLCFHLPVLQALLEDPAASALYLFPTKALAHDQEAALRRLLGALSLPDTIAASYDGDTPWAARARIRREAQLLLTNPDMLHRALLPRHPQWASFFRNLRYVVLDELHAYRGLFGSHVANVLRRLQRVCAFYGSHPQFLCASATIGNPDGLARALLGLPVTLIEGDGAPRGRLHLLLYNPPFTDRALGLRRSFLGEAEELAHRFLKAGVATVLFARTRLSVELLYSGLRARRHRSVRPYRGGYLPGPRREIESRLRSGELLGVVATNALELGVDIGTLAACVIAGYPGTIASTWQQVGRAGRRESASVAILVAGPSPLDQYLANHPEYFFELAPEQAYIHPENPYLLAAHLPCAAYELPLSPEEDLVGGVGRHVLRQLVAEGQLLPDRGRYFWIGHRAPADQVSLRAVTGDAVRIAVRSAAEQRILGQIDRPSAPRLVHEGAIYLHEGRPYLVEKLDWEEGVAHVRPAEVEYYTVAQTEVSWEVVREEESAPIGEGSCHRGEVQVEACTVSYRRLRLFTHEVIGEGEVRLPPQGYRTQAWWLLLPWEAQELLRPDYGPNWETQRRRARERDGYVCRACGLPEGAMGREHDVHHIVPFRKFNYRPGENEAYLEANRLENLITLCRRCHARCDHGPREGPVVALQGLGHLLHQVAALFLMCDPADIEVTTRLRYGPEGLPVVMVYDTCPGGAGLSPALLGVARALLSVVLARLEECPCGTGCPSCIGPTVPGEERAKERIAEVLRKLLWPATVPSG
jgi:DEAD/DEAH box helicase domain-containing protein